MKNILELNEKKVPVVRIDKSLNKYDNIVLFTEKVNKAKEAFKFFRSTNGGKVICTLSVLIATENSAGSNAEPSALVSVKDVISLIVAAVPGCEEGLEQPVTNKDVNIINHTLFKKLLLNLLFVTGLISNTTIKYGFN